MDRGKGLHTVTASGKVTLTEKTHRKDSIKKASPHARSEVINAAIEELETPGSAAQ